MSYAALSLIFLAAAITLGFVKKINVGIASMGLAFVLGLIGNVSTKVILGGFPSKLFITLLGTMFFFCLLQENRTLELLSKKMVAKVGGKTFLIPIIIYLVSYILSAAGPGAISVQSVMVIFAVSLASEMNASPLLLGCMAVLGAVGGTASPIALTGIIVSDLTAGMNLPGAAEKVFYGVTAANVVCAIVMYIVFKGYKLKADLTVGTQELPKFTRGQLLCVAALLVLVVTVVGFRYDVGLVSFALSLALLLCGVVNEKAALKLVPWSVLLLICGVNVLMAVAKHLKGIELLSSLLASMMNESTASAIMGLTGGIMSWFSSANGVVFPTLIPAVPSIAAQVGGSVSPLEMIMAIVGSACVAGISPLSTGGSLIFASYAREAKNDSDVQAVFAKLFLTSFGAVLIIVILAFIGVLGLFC